MSRSEGHAATISDRARSQRRQEKRDPDYVVRVRVGSSRRSWATIGYAWKRENGDGFSVQLNTLPINPDWGGVLKLLPPYIAEEDMPDDNEVQP